jgi:hypothetical protein
VTLVMLAILVAAKVMGRGTWGRVGAGLRRDGHVAFCFSWDSSGYTYDAHDLGARDGVASIIGHGRLFSE